RAVPPEPEASLRQRVRRRPRSSRVTDASLLGRCRAPCVNAGLSLAERQSTVRRDEWRNKTECLRGVQPREIGGTAAEWARPVGSDRTDRRAVIKKRRRPRIPGADTAFAASRI